MKNTFILSLLLAVPFLSISQEFEVPVEVVLEDKEDYAYYEEDILDCIDWLENTPINRYMDKRKEANAFFVQWISGSPSVTIELDGGIVGFAEKNPELLVSYMGGWTRLVLENPDLKDDKVKGNVAGLESAIKVYQKNLGAGIRKDKDMEKLIKVYNKGELEDWVTQRVR